MIVTVAVIGTTTSLPPRCIWGTGIGLSCTARAVLPRIGMATDRCGPMLRNPALGTLPGGRRRAVLTGGADLTRPDNPSR